MTKIEAVQVGDLEEGEASDLLLRCAKIKAMMENTKREAALIAKELGYFALAVALAGAYIAATPRIRSRLETYLPEYRQRRKALLSRRAQRQVHRYGESVLTTWETSYDAIAKQLPEAPGILRLLSFLSPDDIFYELFTPLLGISFKSAAIWGGTCGAETDDDVVTQDTIDSALEVLSKYSLVSWKEEQSSYTMHKLVHTWAYQRMSKGEQLEYGQEVFEFIGNLLAGQPYGPAMKTRLVPHIMACFSRLQEQVSVKEQVKGKSLKSLATCSDFMRHNGQFNQGIEICLLRCEISRHLRSDNEADNLNGDHDLAQMYWHQGRYEDAEELQMKVLDIRKRVLGEEHPDTLASMGNLALAYSNQGRYEDAEELQVTVLDIMKRVLGEEHPSTLTSMGNLALTYSDQGRYEDAEELQMKVLEIRKRVLGEEHPDTLTSMNNLAVTLFHQRRLREAMKLMLQCVETQGVVLGEKHPHTASSVAWLKAIEMQLQAARSERTEVNLADLTIVDAKGEEVCGHRNSR